MIIFTQLLIKTIEYYYSNETDCFMLLLDLSKTFDRIEFVRLFTLVVLELCVILYYA